MHVPGPFTRRREGRSWRISEMQDKNAFTVEAMEDTYDCPTSLQRGILRVEYLKPTYATPSASTHTSLSLKWAILFVSVSA